MKSAVTDSCSEPCYFLLKFAARLHGRFGTALVFSALAGVACGAGLHSYIGFRPLPALAVIVL